MNRVMLCKKNFDPYQILSDFNSKIKLPGISGAQSVFIGFMRNTNNERDDIISMLLDFYPNMTNGYLKNLSKNSIQKYKLDNVLIVHRVGDVVPGECLVIVACWSKHRKESNKAVSDILEDLKHNAPLWKKEFYSDNSFKWVEENTQI
jgi:molybdopterin synthase catalytic subunit